MTNIDAINPLDDRFIDLIVEGEMSPAELRAAIDRLDGQPDGWKRCALAFLEARCWRDSFRSLRPAAQPLPVCQSVSLPAGTQTRNGRPWIRGPIAAAVIAASFVLGWAGHAVRPWAGVAGIAMARGGVNASLPVNGSHPDVPDHGDVDLRKAPRLAAEQRPEKQALPTVNEVIRAVASLHIGTKAAGADVPILAGPGINEQWLKNQPPPVTEYEQVALKRQGYQVDQRRQFFTAVLADGRRVAVPVDQVQIRYTGNDPL